MEQIKINNIFTIGYRCNSDQFLNEILNIRKYSSPFSYMVIDIKTALYFIDNRFNNYTDMNYISKGNNTLTFNKKKWTCNFIHNISEITDYNSDVLDNNKVCIWNHHDLSDIVIINKINKRSQHLINILENESSSLLLFYIEKIQKYEENKTYFDITLLTNYNCKFLILIPLLNFNKDPFIFYQDNKIVIIYFNSNLDSFGTEIHSHVEEWYKLKNIINSIYSFNINERNF